ncbi:MAG: nucleotidyltransferase domain-containing protein [Bacillota bacterium]
MISAHLSAGVEDLARVFREDSGVRAMFIGGSLASGRADEHSDIDAYIIAADDAFERVAAESTIRLGMAGTLLFVKRVDYGFPMDIFIYENGTRGELDIGKSSQFHHLHYRPYTVIFDRDGLLDGYVFPGFGTGTRGPEWLLDTLEWAWREALGARGYLERGDLWSAAQKIVAVRCRVASLLRWVSDPSGPVHSSCHRLGEILPGPAREAFSGSFFTLEARSMARAHRCLCEFLQVLANTGPLDAAARARLQKLTALAELNTSDLDTWKH